VKLVKFRDVLCQMVEKAHSMTFPQTVFFVTHPQTGIIYFHASTLRIQACTGMATFSIGVILG